MINTNTSVQRRLNVRKMTVIGVLSAISIMISMIPFIGYIPIGPMKATIMHVPVIIGAIYRGTTGRCNHRIDIWINKFMECNHSTSNILSPLFINPLVSVLPRILIGIIAYYVYQGVL